MSKRIKHKSPAVGHRLQTTDADLQATDRDALVRMSSQMYLIREFESRLLELITPKMQYAVNRTLAEIMGLREGWCCQVRGKLTLAMLRHAAERARA